MPGSTSLAASIVAVLVEETSTALRALRDTITIDIGIDLDTTDVALELVLVLDCPADNVHIDRSVGELFEASKRADPFVVLLLQRRLNAGALGSSDSRVALPADAVVDLALAGHDLVVAIVLEAKRVGVGVHLVLPDLFEAGLEVCRRVPGLLSEIAPRGAAVGPGIGVVEGKALRLKGTHWFSVAAVDMGVHITGDSTSDGTRNEGGDSESGLHVERV